jgi:clan AA aspartic protease
MGTFSVPIEIGDPQGRRFQRLDALVDTGATYLVVSREVLASLGIRPVRRRSFTLADGRTVEYEMGVVSLRIDGDTLPTLCVFGDHGGQPLLGAVALETFLLAPDPVNQRLVPVPGKLMGLLS